MFSPSSRSRLTHHDLGRFPGEALFDRIGRVVCLAGCLPRKELFEAWEMARRVRRRLRGGRIVDLGGGHGLLAQILLVLDDTSPSAIVADKTLPPSSATLHEELVRAWPRIAERVQFVQADLDDVPIAAADLVVSSHACGALTDRVIARAVGAHAAVAVLPCCHDLASCDPGQIDGWVDGPLAVDLMRAVRLERVGYRIWTQTIPGAITPKNRLLMGQPDGSPTFARPLSSKDE